MQERDRRTSASLVNCGSYRRREDLGEEAYVADLRRVSPLWPTLLGPGICSLPCHYSNQCLNSENGMKASDTVLFRMLTKCGRETFLDRKLLGNDMSEGNIGVINDNLHSLIGSRV